MITALVVMVWQPHAVRTYQAVCWKQEQLVVRVLTAEAGEGAFGGSAAGVCGDMWRTPSVKGLRTLQDELGLMRSDLRSRTSPARQRLLTLVCVSSSLGSPRAPGSVSQAGLTLASPHLFQASILDLHSGALSMGKHFVNLYR